MDLPVMPPLKPMLAKSVKGVPAADSIDGGLSYEPKWDGNFVGDIRAPRATG